MFRDLTIIDLGDGIAPAYCGKLFADLGADVIKVEPPAGDPLRGRAPFAGDEPGPERSLAFAYVNTSKRGLTLDVTTGRGRELLLRLVAAADVVVEGRAPAWLEAHGLDYENLRDANERLIMTSITPFGQDGPWRDYAANDFIAQHTSGVAYNNGSKAPDLDAQPPFPLPGNSAEFLGGLAAASATMCAVIGREATGQGTHVDVAMQEALAMHLHLDLAWTTFAGTPISRATGAQPAIAYVSQQPCADGYIDFVIRTEEQWQNFLDVLGRPDWGDNPLFATGAGRAQYWDALEPLVQEELRKYPKAELYEKSQARGVPAAPVSTLVDAANEGHFADRQAFVDHEQPAIGTLRAPGPPVRFGADGWRIRRPAPALGEHNREVFVERLGLSDAELASLQAEGVI
jgi:crotonobetainyl-CoA:carnitine CoA-transferase CaiB-like acyl-CoA transferase